MLAAALGATSRERVDPKMFADAIHEARTEQDVFDLLNGYVDAIGGGGKPGSVPDSHATLVSCANNVRQRGLELVGKLDMASKRLDDDACLALKEALHVYSSALNRLKSFSREKYRSS